MVLHRLYGLLFGTDQPIPGCAILSESGAIPDVQFHLKSENSPHRNCSVPLEPVYMSRMRDENGIPVLQVVRPDENHLALLYSDGTRFVLGREGTEVFVDWPDSLTLEDTAPYVVGPVLGMVLRLRGVVPLHASAVAIGDHAIALAGPAGAGKSTTAAAFARCGYRVISDDVVALKQEGPLLVVPPGYPRVNLWTESVQGILGEMGTLPLISPSWNKYFMPLEVCTQFETRSLPLGCIYLLQKSKLGVTEPIIEPMAGTDAFVPLLGNTYMNYLPDSAGRRQEFELLARVVDEVPIRRIQVTTDFSMLPRLCAAIAADVEKTFIHQV